MKKITILALFLLAITAHAQFSVAFYGANTNGIPAYWPKCILQTTNPPAGFVLMTQSQLDQIISTNQAAYNGWESNRTYAAQVKLTSDLQDLLDKLDKVEAWIDKTSGTNSLSNNQRDNAINDICRAFKKLRPVLKDNYKPE